MSKLRLATIGIALALIPSAAPLLSASAASETSPFTTLGGFTVGKWHWKALVEPDNPHGHRKSRPCFALAVSADPHPGQLTSSGPLPCGLPYYGTAIPDLSGNKTMLFVAFRDATEVRLEIGEDGTSASETKQVSLKRLSQEKARGIGVRQFNYAVVKLLGGEICLHRITAFSASGAQIYDATDSPDDQCRPVAPRLAEPQG
jgi:hypothetical protein